MIIERLLRWTVRHWLRLPEMPTDCVDESRIRETEQRLGEIERRLEITKARLHTEDRWRRGRRE